MARVKFSITGDEFSDFKPKAGGLDEHKVHKRNLIFILCVMFIISLEKVGIEQIPIVGVKFSDGDDFWAILIIAVVFIYLSLRWYATGNYVHNRHIDSGNKKNRRRFYADKRGLKTAINDANSKFYIPLTPKGANREDVKSAILSVDFRYNNWGTPTSHDIFATIKRDTSKTAALMPERINPVEYKPQARWYDRPRAFWWSMTRHPLHFDLYTPAWLFILFSISYIWQTIKMNLL